MASTMLRITKGTGTMPAVIDGQLVFNTATQKLYLDSGTTRYLMGGAKVPTPSSLTISLNGSSQGAWDGSSAKSINITPGSIGAMRATPTSIELNSDGSLEGYGGFVDFHYNGSSSDYTSRILETASGVLTINNMTFNASTKTITATTFSGNATSATKATQDGNGNVIASTYLPLSGGTLTGVLNLNRGSDYTHLDLLRKYGDVQWEFAYYMQSGSPAGLLDVIKAGTIVNRITLAEHNTTLMKSLIIQGSVSIGNGNDLNLVASSTSTSDSGDIVFKAYDGSELMRIWYGSSPNVCYIRWAGGTSQTVLHSGNYTNYTVTKTGSGASGTWGIISAKSNQLNMWPNASTSANGPGLYCIPAGAATVGNTANYSVDTPDTLSSSIQYGTILRIKYNNNSVYYTDIYSDTNKNALLYKTVADGTSKGWVRLLDSSNYTNYTVTKTGTGASGNWGISISGAAATLKINNTANLGDCLQYMQTSSQTAGNDLPSSTWYHVLKMNHGTGDTYYKRLLAFNFFSNTIQTNYASGDGTLHDWATLILSTGGAMTGNLTSSASIHLGSTSSNGYCDLQIRRKDSASSAYGTYYSYVQASAQFGGTTFTDGTNSAELRIYPTYIYIPGTAAATSTTTGALRVAGGLGVAGNIYGASVYGAVWNDYAEYRSGATTEPGKVVKECPDGILRITESRLEPGCEIISDTFGFAIGETDECKTPVATSGRVLAYPFEDRDTFELGQAVCSGPNGTVSKMTREEIMMYPERIIGTVSEIPQYETWGTGNVQINGRIWIRIR